jgi:hypothetical protein
VTPSPSLIDSHCHIAGPEFAADLEAVVTRARDTGVRQALVILASEDEVELRRAHEVAGLWPEVRFSVGVHPHNAGRFAANPADAASLTEQGAGRTAPGAGRGRDWPLDYHYDHPPGDAAGGVRGADPLAPARACHRDPHRSARTTPSPSWRRTARSGRLPLLHRRPCASGAAGSRRRFSTCRYRASSPSRGDGAEGGGRLRAATGCWSKTDSPYLALVPHRGAATSRPTSAVCAVVAELRQTTAGRWPPRRPPTSRALFNP